MAARGLREPGDIFIDGVGHKNFVGLALHGSQLGGVGHRMEGVKRVCGLPVPQDVDLAFKIGVAHRQPDHEAVKLGGRKHLCTRRSHRILGCNDNEGLRHRAGDSVEGDVPFLHHLQQRRLGFA